MKPIEETHPSFKGKVEIYSVPTFPDGTLSCEGVCYIEDVQKHTIDKAVLKDAIDSTERHIDDDEKNCPWEDHYKRCSDRFSKVLKQILELEEE